MSTRRLSQFKKDYKRFKQWIKLDFIPAYRIYKDFYLCSIIRDYRRYLGTNRSITLGEYLSQKQKLTILEIVIDSTLTEHYWKMYGIKGESVTLGPYLESKIKSLDSPRAKRIAWMLSITYEQYLEIVQKWQYFLK